MYLKFKREIFTIISRSTILLETRKILSSIKLKNSFKLAIVSERSEERKKLLLQILYRRYPLSFLRPI